MADSATENGVSTVRGEAQSRVSEKFSWCKPHATFVIVLIGKEEVPFGIPKDFLCSRSSFFRSKLDAQPQEPKLENIILLPQFTAEVFGLAQQYLYTGIIRTEDGGVPSYESLVALWRIGHELGVDGLCDKTLDAMIECRKLTQEIPATPLLVHVWNEAPEGSPIRTLLLSWAAEYMRSSESRAGFAKSLPQEVLSELVVMMSAVGNPPAPREPEEPPPRTSLPNPEARNNVHHLPQREVEGGDAGSKRRRSFGGTSQPLVLHQGSVPKKHRVSLPKPHKRRSAVILPDAQSYTPAQRLAFCEALLTRMLSGPGFWTRLVGPFKEAVRPSQDGVPDYFTKVKKPMDLGTMKDKMDRGKYTSDDEFLSDMRQIFQNCYIYWKKGDPMWMAAERLQKSFEDKYATMHKWLVRVDDDEE